MSDASEILQQIGRGEKTTSNELLPILYGELRRLASQKLSLEQESPSLQPTLLVHDAYLRLVKNQDAKWDSCEHFFASAAEAMRRILIEHARRKQTRKHGGDLERVGLSVIEPEVDSNPVDLIELDEALSLLEEKWPDRAKLVTLRYFAGMTIADASKVMGISTATAERHWKFAKAFLYAQLSNS